MFLAAPKKKKIVLVRSNYAYIIYSLFEYLSIFLNLLRLPALLKISTEKITVKRLKNDIKQLNNRLSELQALLEAKKAEIFHLKR
jgi:WD repeat-containing protein 91